MEITPILVGNYPYPNLKLTLAPVRITSILISMVFFQSIGTVHFHISLTNHFHLFITAHGFCQLLSFLIAFMMTVRFHSCLTAKAFWSRPLSSPFGHRRTFEGRSVSFLSTVNSGALNRSLSPNWTVHFPQRTFTFTSAQYKFRNPLWWRITV